LTDDAIRTLTPEQAFKAMFYYLDAYWRRFQQAEVRDVLGDIQPAEAGTSSDPAAWEDWLLCVRRVVEDEDASNGSHS
jgi:hypothetical protein